MQLIYCDIEVTQEVSKSSLISWEKGVNKMEAGAYIAYLPSEAGRSSCVRSGRVREVSHDEVSRFLATGSFSGKDLFAKAKPAGKPAIVPQRG